MFELTATVTVGYDGREVGHVERCLAAGVSLYNESGADREF